MRPRPSTPSVDPGLLQNPPDFSLVLGGPFFQLLRRAHLADDALLIVRRRIVIISLFTYLLLLSTLDRHLLRGSVAVPFLFDMEVHARCLVALPLLIASELVVHRWMRSLVASQ